MTKIDDDNVVEWIRGKKDLKPGLAFPPDFLKREYKPSTKEKKIPVINVKVPKIDPTDLKGLPKVKAKAKDVEATLKVQKAATVMNRNKGPVIRVLVDKYPHKAGTLAEIKSNGFKDGMLVTEYKKNSLGIKGSWQASHLKYCVDKGLVKIEG